jgi:photosystem II stability/assembly factor-like uncharacterized protein
MIRGADRFAPFRFIMRLNGGRSVRVTELVVATGDDLVRMKLQNDQWCAVKLRSGRGMQCLAEDTANRDVLYAGSHGEGVWKSTSRGDDCRRLDFAEPNVFSLAVSPADGALYVGTEPSKLFVSRDEGNSWRELDGLQRIPSKPSWSFPPRPWTSHVRSVAPSPHNGRLLLVGIELGGLMRSEDGGETWSDHRPGAQKDVHTSMWHPSVLGRAYEAGGGGAAWSRDGGLSWQPADAGRDRHYTWGLAADPDDPDCWYVSANPGARLAHYGAENADASIYRWRGAGPWQPLGGGLPQPLDSFPYVLATAADSLFAGLGDGRIYGSDDGGENWKQLDVHGEPPERVLEMIVTI